VGAGRFAAIVKEENAVSDENQETMYDYSNRVDAERAAARAPYDEAKAAEDARYAHTQREAEREGHFLNQRSSAQTKPVKLPASCGGAIALFLILMWGTQFILWQASRLLGAASPQEGMNAVAAVNNILVIVLLIGVGLGWWTWVRQRRVGRALLRVLIFAMLALGISTWQLALGLQHSQAAQRTADGVNPSAAGAPAVSEPAVATASSPTAPTTATRVVTADVLMLRAAPSTSAAVIRKLYAKQQVTLLDQEQLVAAIRWVKIRVAAQEGWVSAAYLR
jgi:hypothetical protein